MRARKDKEGEGRRKQGRQKGRNGGGKGDGPNPNSTNSSSVANIVPDSKFTGAPAGSRSRAKSAVTLVVARSNAVASEKEKSVPSAFPGGGARCQRTGTTHTHAWSVTVRTTDTYRHSGGYRRSRRRIHCRVRVVSMPLEPVARRRRLTFATTANRRPGR